MPRSLKNLLILVASFGLGSFFGANAIAYEFESTPRSIEQTKLYLSFSVGDGAYFNYRCTASSCKTVYVTPVDFEILLGYRLSKHLYLDLGINWGVDYSDYYFERITYMSGVRPGIRLVIPFFVRRFMYFRGAIPVQYTLETEDDHLILGVLLGFGLEWTFGNVGIFGEVDITPYFIEVYPGHYVIPTHGRVGVSIRF